MPILDQTLIWAILLLLLGLSCVVLEMFIPSAGMLGVLAALSILSAIVMAFMSGPWAGLGMTLAVTFLIPILLAIAVRYWPHTPIGKMIMLRRPEPEDVLPLTDAYRTRKQLVGQRGVAQNAMLPSGSVSIAGQSYDAISSGMPIAAGQTVRVIGIDTQRLVVRADESPLANATAKSPPRSSGPEIEDPFAL